VLRSWTSSAAISVLAVAGSKTSTANRWAPANAAASAVLRSTEVVRLEGATWNDTVVPAARATAARQRWMRLARA